jgi:hypothetical protein
LQKLKSDKFENIQINTIWYIIIVSSLGSLDFIRKEELKICEVKKQKRQLIYGKTIRYSKGKRML